MSLRTTTGPDGLEYAAIYDSAFFQAIDDDYVYDSDFGFAVWFKGVNSSQGEVPLLTLRGVNSSQDLVVAVEGDQYRYSSFSPATGPDSSLDVWHHLMGWRDNGRVYLAMDGVDMLNGSYIEDTQDYGGESLFFGFTDPDKNTILDLYDPRIFYKRLSFDVAAFAYNDMITNAGALSLPGVP